MTTKFSMSSADELKRLDSMFAEALKGLDPAMRKRVLQETLRDFEKKVEKAKKASSLRSKLIRLAYERPELRPEILPLVKEGAREDWSASPRAFRAWGALTFAQGQLLDLGLDSEAHTLQRLKGALEKAYPDTRQNGPVFAKGMQSRFGL